MKIAALWTLGVMGLVVGGCARISADDLDWRLDPDGDGVLLGDDCDDNDASVMGAGSYWADADGDGFGDSQAPIESCTWPDGAVLNADDCDDTDGAVYPGAVEVWYDGVDADCAGDDDDDADGDGYAADTQGGDDCDDSDATVYPGAADVWYDGVDGDCAGDDDDDADGDGYPVQEDCDDADASVFPSDDPEIYYNGIDDNCSLFDGDGDKDGDGWWAEDYEARLEADGITIQVDIPDGARDCWDDPTERPTSAYSINGFPNPAAEEMHPEADEVWYDGVDGDCAGPDADFDADGDGYETIQYPQLGGAYGTDCQDGAAADVNPGGVWPASCYPGAATDDPYDGTDCDCAGDSDYDGDGDGYDSDAYGGTDCDDFDAFTSPGEVEVCDDGLDNNCDGGAPECGLSGDVALVSASAVMLGGSSYRAGMSLAAGVDVNGDGGGDVLVGGYGTSGKGAISLVLSPLAGTHDLSSADARLTAADGPGESLASLGDMNHDGYDDFAVGSLSGTGSATVVMGPVSGSSSLSGVATAILQSGGEGAYVAGVGDIDGDGLPDLAVGTPDASTGGTDAGAIYFFSGPVSASGSMDEVTADGTITGDAGQQLQWATPMGDLDADGVADMALGAPEGTTGEGMAWVVLGPITAGVSVSDVAEASFTGTDVGDQAGDSLAQAGDVNGDGYTDLLIGAPGSGTTGADAGAAYLMLGPFSGATALDSADARFYGVSAGDEVGSAVGGPGDLDADGLDDIALGAPGVDVVATDDGVVYVFLGAVSGAHSVGAADARLIGTSGAAAGRALASPGDTDRDGYADILVGAPLDATAGSGAGAAYLLVGGGI